MYEYMFSCNLLNLTMYNEFSHIVYVFALVWPDLAIQHSNAAATLTQTNSAARLSVSQKVNTAAFKTKS